MRTIQCSPSCLSSVRFVVSDPQGHGSFRAGSSSLCPVSHQHHLRDSSVSVTSGNSLDLPVSNLGVRVRAASGQSSGLMRTCRNCKQPFDPESNHPQACRFHSAHFGGETKRKFESVYTGGTMETIGGGAIVEYWHCCGSPDRFDPGCEAAPHASYDD